ncbi:hypothetical protein KOR34_18320 [Posidoniimonas corsicana]|uniref:PEP-CTERM protein-sorting domain-containing protein n=1 Tax=Posidoniimonas corsicana TaxID=1938618 RepID=A0A5C5VG18_9BACT|nr:hypothetical protein [Posidoniimonas corsicana]TWT36887.1 hypothetical protein KOR34_18320 [Posidoniimonas corsicana]
MRSAAAAFAVLLCLASPVCRAELVRFQITASVDAIDDPLGVLAGAVMIGDPLTGLLQYDLAIIANDDNPSPDFGAWLLSPPGDNFIEGSNAAAGNFQTIDSFRASTANNGPLGDRLSFFGTGDTTPSTVEHPNAEYVELNVALTDSDATVLANDQLPSVLNLADYEQAVVTLTAEGFNDNSEFATLYEVSATITQLRRLAGPGPSGDFNGDGAVDAADYTVWRDGLGLGYVAQDYNTWRAGYGASAASLSATAAPEPAALAGALLAVMGAGGHRYRRG